MFKLIDRYLIKLYLKYYFSSLLVLTFLFLLIDVLTTLNRFQVAGHVYLGYYLYYIPWMISQMMPIAGVLATVFLFVSIQKNNELVVFYSLGISIYRVLAPLLALLFLISVFGWFLSDKIVPKSMEQRNYYYYVEMKKNPASYNRLKKANVWLRTPDAIINFKKVLSESEVQGVTVYFYDKEKWRPTRILNASSASLNEDSWVYKNGVDTRYDTNGVTSEKFEEVLTKPLEDLTEFKKRQSRVEAMTLSELSNAIDKAKASSMATRLLETEYHAKLSFIFSALFLSLLALPFSIGNQRSSNMFVGLGVTLALVLGYWISYSSSLNLGRTGILPPLLAAWLPGLVCILVFFVLIKRKTA